MTQFLNNILASMASFIGFAILPTIIIFVYQYIERKKEVQKNQEIWISVFQSAASKYLEQCKLDEDYTEILAFQNFNKLSIEQLQKKYYLQYIEKKFIDLDSGEIIDRSFYQIVKINNSS